MKSLNPESVQFLATTAPEQTSDLPELLNRLAQWMKHVQKNKIANNKKLS